MTANSLARLLNPFKIKPEQVRIGEISKKGYERDWFNDAFARYLPGMPIENETTKHATADAPSSVFQSETQKDAVSDSKTLKLMADRGCFGVSFQNSELGRKTEQVPLVVRASKFLAGDSAGWGEI